MLKYFSFEMSDTAVSGECGEKKKKKKECDVSPVKTRYNIIQSYILGNPALSCLIVGFVLTFK